jgi:hypothetical protein
MKFNCIFHFSGNSQFSPAIGSILEEGKFLPRSGHCAPVDMSAPEARLFCFEKRGLILASRALQVRRDKCFVQENIDKALEQLANEPNLSQALKSTIGLFIHLCLLFL